MTQSIYAIVVAGALACGRPGHDAASAGAAPAAATEPQTSAPFAAAAGGPDVLREEATVRVGTVPERWALVWRRPPAPVCAADDAASALTCPCDGFAYGEQGELDLVRRRPGRPDVRLALTPLFRNGENPAWREQLAVLQRWPVGDTDYEAMDSPDLAAAVRARPVTRAVALGDYDHDGRATEFLLQVGASPCGHQDAVVVGVSAADPSLHAFTSVGHPERPLVLEPFIWTRLLRSNGTVEAVEWQCGDHGAETQTEVSLRAGPTGIDGTRSEYQCTTAGAKGRLLSTKRI